MSRLMISILNKEDEVICKASGDNNISLVYGRKYQEGDKIRFDSSPEDKYLVIKADDALGEAMVYITVSSFQFLIPFGEEKNAYAPEAFCGGRHNISLRTAVHDEIFNCRNLAVNGLDQRGHTTYYPHISTNNETRGESVFAARNVIDGSRESNGHGLWPYTSWGPDISMDSEILLEFGRTVEIDKIVLYLRSDFPHDSYWNEGTILFSDGTSRKISLLKVAGPQSFMFVKKRAEWLKLLDLKKADEPAEFPALTQIEVYGKDC